MRRHAHCAAFALAFTLGACGSDTGNAPVDTGVSSDVPPDAVADTGVTDTGGVQTDAAPSDSDPGDTAEAEAGEVRPGTFGAPCQGNIDCLDGYCVEGAEGYFCTRGCDLECPDGFDCRSVLSGSADTVFLCMPRLKKVCLPCTSDYQCTGGACLQIDGVGECGYVCAAETDCPAGYGCLPDAAGTHSGTYCQPKSGSCTCTTELAGSIRTCVTTNGDGTCYGLETCDPTTGWGGCDAPTAVPETCDGRDNNCNALVDEGIPNNVPCENTVESVGTCAGTRICIGVQGYVCTAATPEAEVCDFRDNDCDGETDDGFRAADGSYTLAADCGTCGNDCGARIPHGTGRCDAGGDTQPICVVDSCDPDYIAIGRFMCALPPDVSCQPCKDTADCYGGSCIALDGQKVCVVACGDAGACADGYTCETVDDAPRCMPIARSCVCSAVTDGQLRTCAETNAVGTCFGQETCDAASGWVGCTAQTPTAEACNGLDDDCNGRADDAVAPPAEPCEASLPGVGTCTGVWRCGDAGSGSVAWFCNALAPSVEACDFADNDCDGATDEAFRDASGLYIDQHHCGSCGVSCDDAIPNAATTACVVSGARARCEVATCAPGFYRAGPLTCMAVSDETCAPCASDANCPTPGDRCLALDGGHYCGRDCSAANVHGTPAGECPTGTACEAIAGAGEQCVPTSGSCTCMTAAHEGKTRSCLQTSEAGTCFGQEVCQTATGWTVCSARVPAPETCDGVDDDCNAAVDDVAGRGGACTIANDYGTCAGTLQCPASGPALVCEGKTPAAETCNYLDDDCNGQTDEGAAFAEKGKVCTVGTGYCQATGVGNCTADGLGVACSVVAGNPRPGGELCNDIDDDCDTQTDEAFTAKGTLCTDGVGQCTAYGTNVCKPDGSGLTCTAVRGAQAAEVCDLADNDCDGSVDEDFKTGTKYTAVTACGNCFTNCTAIYARPHASGTCDAAPATPTCKMVCDSTYYDLNAAPDDGCEFQLEAAALYVSQSDVNAVDNAGCGAGPTTTGGGRYPCKSIGYAITKANAPGSGKTKVLVAAGAYYGSLTLKNGISVYGGYSSVNWLRDVAANITAVFGTTASGHRATVSADAIGTIDTTFDGFTVYGQVATGTAENSYAVWVKNPTNKLHLTHNVVWPGTGGPGQNGTRGNDGTAGGNGAAGKNAGEAAGASCYSAVCEAGRKTGGTGGANTGCTSGTAGGTGGDGHCPDFNESSNLCTTSTSVQDQVNTNGGAIGGGTAGGTAGIGGCDSQIDYFRDNTCVCSNPSSTAGGCTLGKNSSAGGNGGGGTPGSKGAANASAAGQLSATFDWQGFAGAGAGDGTNGAGGGGGGAGGGVETYAADECADDGVSDYGGSGGGGGAGGCGGTGGGGGGAGGGAFGIYLVFTATPTSLPDVSGNTLHLGYGGRGGRGGDGGTAGVAGHGGAGGSGGTPGSALWCAAPGSKGGEGGNGGPGGGGAGGAGGVTYGLSRWTSAGVTVTPPATWTSGNGFTTDGAGGDGGIGGGVGAGGHAGDPGLSGDARERNW